jgi:hypothetical protein
MMRVLLRPSCVVFTVFVSCLGPVSDRLDSGFDPNITLIDDGGTRCVAELGSVGQVCAPLTPGTCGGARCAVGEGCCLLTSRCFPLAQPAQCPTPVGADGPLRRCASALDCGLNEVCFAEDAKLCGGPGRCVPITNCGACTGGLAFCAVCGCNGITYESPQVACVAGVRSLRGACSAPDPRGATCGRSEQCAMSEACCPLTGRCYSTNEPWRCPADADGGVLDCLTNAECGSGAGGGGAAAGSWCAGERCGTPGRCTGVRRASECPGTLEPVCGCDGRTYLNECQARAQGTRVASRGSCPDAGP